MNPKEEQLCDQEFPFQCKDDFHLQEPESLPDLNDIEAKVENDDKFSSCTSNNEKKSEKLENEPLTEKKKSRKENIPTVGAVVIDKKTLQLFEELKSRRRQISNTEYTCDEDLTRKEMNQTVDAVLEAFFQSGNVQVAVQNISKLITVKKPYMFISEGIDYILQFSKWKMEMFGQLLYFLVKSKIVSVNEYKRGFSEILEQIFEYSVMYPNVYNCLGLLLQLLIKGNSSNLLFLKDILKPCIPSISAGNIMSAVLHRGCKKTGTRKVAEMWRESGLKWTDFLPSYVYIPEFISAHKLSYTISHVVKSEPPSQLHKYELEEKIFFMLTSNVSNGCVFDWVEEATNYIMELNCASTMPIIIAKAMNQVLEQSSQNRVVFGQLLCYLLRSKAITIYQYNDGFRPVLKSVDDYAEKIPKIWEYLAEIIEPMIDDQTSDLTFLKYLLKPIIYSQTAGKLVSAILHCAASKRGTKKVGEMWNESGLQLGYHFLPCYANVSDFISKYKLEFIRPVISEPPGGWYIAEIKKKITFMLTPNAFDKDVLDWVKTDIKDMTCVFEHTVAGDSDNVYATDRGKGKYRFALICKHVAGKDDLQIQTMYAVQDFANKPNYPNGLLKQLCDYLHDENIISQELQEKGKSVDAGEQEGQGVALFSINSLLEEESESESSSEDEL